MRNGICEGNLIDWINNTGVDVVSGQVVVVGTLLAVATVNIANGESGVVKVGYAITAPKVVAADIKQGETLTWDVSAGAFDDDQAVAAVGDITGQAAWGFSDAGVGATTVEVVLTGLPGTVN